MLIYTLKPRSGIIFRVEVYCEIAGRGEGSRCGEMMGSLAGFIRAEEGIDGYWAGGFFLCPLLPSSPPENVLMSLSVPSWFAAVLRTELNLSGTRVSELLSSHSLLVKVWVENLTLYWY